MHTNTTSMNTEQGTNKKQTTITTK